MSAMKGKIKNWGNEYERLGVALMKYVNHSGAKDDGTFIVKDEIITLESAIRGHAALTVSAEARSAFGLPALVINETITQTWLGLSWHQAWRSSHHGVREAAGYSC